MEPIPHETWQSFIRSRPRRRLTILLSSLGEASLGQLAHTMRIRPARVKALLFGKPPSYSVELGLVTLGLVEEIPKARGRAWRITGRGRRKARSMLAARRRREVGERDEPQPPPPDPATGVVTWTFEVK